MNDLLDFVFFLKKKRLIWVSFGLFINATRSCKKLQPTFIQRKLLPCCRLSPPRHICIKVSFSQLFPVASMGSFSRSHTVGCPEQLRWVSIHNEWQLSLCQWFVIHNVQVALMIFWVSSGFCLATLQWMPFLPSHFWNCKSSPFVDSVNMVLWCHNAVY